MIFLKDDDGPSRGLFERDQCRPPEALKSSQTIPLFIYRSPNTGHRLQGFSAEDVGVDVHTDEPIICAVCRQTHMVNPATGAVLGVQSRSVGE